MTEQEYKHRCLVVYVIRWRLKDESAAKLFIDRWMDRYPDSSLRKDILRQWKLGNRGHKGDWRESNE